MTELPLDYALSRLAMSTPVVHEAAHVWMQKPAATKVGDRLLHNITDHFKAAASDLNIGDIVKDAEFTLFESVGALEIMDPKMDSGCLGPGETLEDKYDVLKDLLPDEVIGIMDQMLCCEMAWHEGYPLSQTVFSSHYVDKILRYSDEAKTIDNVRLTKTSSASSNIPLMPRVMRSYCIAMIKCCDLSLETITQSGHFYEEEDFSTHTYGRNLLQKIHESEVAKLLVAVIAEVSRLEQLLHRDAILIRLRHRLSLLSAMSCQFNEGRFEGRPTNLHWEDMRLLTTKVAETHAYARTVPDAFSPKIQRTLASTQPPRPLVELQFGDAVSKLQSIASDCIETERIIALQPRSAEQLKVLLMAFSSRQPEPLPYARACLTRSVLSEGDEGFGEIFKVDLRETVLPAAAVLDPYNWTLEAPLQTKSGARDFRYESATVLTNFTNMFTASLGGYTDIFRALLSNRCRLRRNLSHVVRTFDAVNQAEAREVDEFLNQLGGLPNALQSWTGFQQRRLMILTVQLGFELEVYLPDELCMMHRYLAQLLDQVGSIFCRDIESRLAILRTQRSSFQALARKEIDNALHFIQAVSTYACASNRLAWSLKEIYQVLSYLGLIPQPKRPKNSEEWETRRWEVRMKPFLHLRQPDLQSHDIAWDDTHPFGDYVSSVDETPMSLEQVLQQLSTAEDLCRNAHSLFLESEALGPAVLLAHGAEEFWSRDVSGCLASCLDLSNAILGIRKALQEKRIGTVRVETKSSGRSHRWWIVPVVNDTPGRA